MMKHLGLFITLASLLLSCTSPTEYDFGIDDNGDCSEYIVYGTVMRDSTVVPLTSVYMYIVDPNYSRGQTEFECKTDYMGRFKFIVMYKDWDGYGYQLHTNAHLQYGQINFCVVERRDFNL